MKTQGTRGFTLIELMIAVAIVGILAAIAYPIYTEQMRKAARSEGESALLRLAQLQERWYTTNSTYTVTLGQLYGPSYAGLTNVSSNEDPSKPGKYTIEAVAGPSGIAQGYVLTAKPAAPFVDPVCGNLSLSSTGARTYSVTSTPRTSCW